MDSNRRHVLVMDDDTSSRQIIQTVLEDAGYVVEEAAEGASALARLQASQEPMVALLDLRMSGVDGFQVLRTVAAEPPLATRHAYIVFTANTVSPGLNALRAQIQAPLLSKPLDVDQLLAAVEKAAERLN